VIVAGVATTALILTGSWAMEHSSKGDFTLMGLYLWGLVPVGAFGLGLAAATGYYVAALLTGTRIRGGLLWSVIAVTVAAYFGMHYVQFRAMGPMALRSTGARLTFARYYDVQTRNLRFVSTAGSKPAPAPILPNSGPPLPAQNGADADDALGYWGYGVRALELGAFSLGALCTPLVLRGKPFCDLCERYHKRYRLAVIPASVKLKVVRARRTVRLDGEHAVVGQKADATVAQLTQAVRAGELAAVGQLIDSLRPASKQAAKVPRRVEIILNRCPQCGHGTLTPTLCVGTDPRNPTRKVLWSVPVDPAFGDTLQPR
jgi:hypothetical protein